MCFGAKTPAVFPDLSRSYPSSSSSRTGTQRNTAATGAKPGPRNSDFHKGGFETHPSCQLYCGDTKDIPFGSYHCFTCNESGTLCKFIGACFDESEDFGSRWLLERFGNTFVTPTFDLEPIIINKDKEVEYINEKDILQKFESFMLKVIIFII